MFDQKLLCQHEKTTTIGVTKAGNGFIRNPDVFLLRRISK